MKEYNESWLVMMALLASEWENFREGVIYLNEKEFYKNFKELYRFITYLG